MRNRFSAAAAAAMAAALASLAAFGNILNTELGHNKGDYQRPPRPRKYRHEERRAGIKALDLAKYEKRYGLGFRYKVGSRPFSARAAARA